jgi:hypothetical protein
MRLLLALILAVAVGAASPPKAIDSDPVSLITAIYQTYLDNTELLTDIYSKRLEALLDKDAQETPEGMVGRIDWDVFVDGQDFALKELKIVAVSQDETKAQIRATSSISATGRTCCSTSCTKTAIGASTRSRPRSRRATSCRRSSLTIPARFPTPFRGEGTAIRR